MNKTNKNNNTYLGVYIVYKGISILFKLLISLILLIVLISIHTIHKIPIIYIYIYIIYTLRFQLVILSSFP